MHAGGKGPMNGLIKHGRSHLGVAERAAVVTATVVTGLTSVVTALTSVVTVVTGPGPDSLITRGGGDVTRGGGYE